MPLFSFNNLSASGLILVGLVLLPFAAGGGEKLVPLNGNPVKHQYQEENPYPVAAKKRDQDTVSLPFFDDFSNSMVYPSDSLWKENQVFINHSFPLDPVSKNVATFDGLDEDGQPYKKHVEQGNEPADTLTSAPIDLSGKTEADSIYLSFFYQPQGRGMAPGEENRLTLEFKPEGTNEEVEWQQVWAQEGSKVHPFRFVSRVVPDLEDLNYFYEGFRFRFINYANPSGNLDHWHLDYIHLDEGRNHQDTLKLDHDVSLVNRPAGLMANYRSMPKRQFESSISNERRDQIEIEVTNLSAETGIKNVEYSYRIKDLTNDIILRDFERDLAGNLSPGNTRTFTRDNQFDIGQVSDENFDVGLTIEANTSPDFHEPNNVFSIEQQFNQYLAYDDGIPEMGYKLDLSNRPQGRAAQRYSINEPDSLRAVGIHFNRSVEDISNRTFDLVIWDDINPGTNEGEVLHIKEDLNPEYSDSLHGFTTFFLEEAVAVEDEFYVGFRQHSDYKINIGVDVTYPQILGQETRNPNLFYNINNEWEPTGFYGTLMIRPYLNQEDWLFVSNEEEKTELAPEPDVYPNPVSERLNVAFEENRDFSFKLINMNGQILREGRGRKEGTIRVNDLDSGFYVLQVITDRGGYSKKVRKRH